MKIIIWHFAITVDYKNLFLSGLMTVHQDKQYLIDKILINTCWQPLQDSLKSKSSRGDWCFTRWWVVIIFYKRGRKYSISWSRWFDTFRPSLPLKLHNTNWEDFRRSEINHNENIQHSCRFCCSRLTSLVGHFVSF